MRQPSGRVFFGGPTSEHREVMALYRLHFEVMRAAKAMGHDEYDLWGIAPGHDARNSWRSFSACKTKLGGDPVHLVPTQDFVLDEAAHAR